ncbi:MAG: hypothetical protein FRX49_10080 [Trebouxia sp. A1-2]|nr:MAG: hypothetical protein FRX49_10080 [Trebouxia sp. A1-2]
MYVYNSGRLCQASQQLQAAAPGLHAQQGIRLESMAGSAPDGAHAELRRSEGLLDFKGLRVDRFQKVVFTTSTGVAAAGAATSPPVSAPLMRMPLRAPDKLGVRRILEPSMGTWVGDLSSTPQTEFVCIIHE